jgi:hypothetical protein
MKENLGFFGINIVFLKNKIDEHVASCGKKISIHFAES